MPGSALFATLVTLSVLAGPARSSAQDAPSPDASVDTTSAQTAPVGGGKGRNLWTIPALTFGGAAVGGGAGLLTGVVIGLVRVENGLCGELAGCPVLAAAAYGSKGLAIGAVVGLVGGLVLGIALFDPPAPSQPQTLPQPQPQLPPEIALVPLPEGCQTSVAFRF
jgi:hypothetical protein